MPQNEFGYKHVLVIVCYLSKFVIARPLRTKTSAEVVAELLSVYLTFGVPQICQHDQGREFTSKEFSELHQQLLLNLSKYYSTYPSEQSSEDESIHSNTLIDPFADETEITDNLGEEMKFIREENESEARLNIKVEEKRQKRIYDKKVKTNREKRC